MLFSWLSGGGVVRGRVLSLETLPDRGLDEAIMRLSRNLWISGGLTKTRLFKVRCKGGLSVYGYGWGRCVANYVTENSVPAFSLCFGRDVQPRSVSSDAQRSSQTNHNYKEKLP